MRTPVASILLFAHAPYAKFLPESLGSILSQSYGAFEVIVLSDGSEEVRESVEREARGDRRVSVRPQGTEPFLQAANKIMKERSGKYLATWNSDDIYAPDHVKLLVEALEMDHETGAAFDNARYFRDDGGTVDRGDEFVIPLEKARSLALSRVSVQQIVADNFMIAPCSLVRREAFEQVGGYDGRIFLNCDLHWFYRIGAYYPFRFVDYVGVYRRIHPLNNTTLNPHYEFGVRELENIRDHYPDVYQRIGAKIFRKKLGRKYFRLGLHYEKLGHLDKARNMYKQAMLLRKLSFRYHWEFCRSSFVSRGRQANREFGA